MPNVQNTHVFNTVLVNMPMQTRQHQAKRHSIVLVISVVFLAFAITGADRYAVVAEPFRVGLAFVAKSCVDAAKEQSRSSSLPLPAADRMRAMNRDGHAAALRSKPSSR